MTLAIVGVGNMGGAMLRGWLDAGTSPDDVLAVVSSAASAERVERDFGVRVVPLAEVAGADTVVLAVKPYQFDAVLEALTVRDGALVLSVAAGVPLARLEQALPNAAVVRAMPNTAAAVGRSVTGVIPGTRAGDDDLVRARELLDAVGSTVVTDEAHLDALTAISGSGPAYLFLVADAMIEAGVHQGLTRALATELTVQTFVGAGAMLEQSGSSASQLREQVTSPKGTTAAALRKLDDHGVRAAFLDAVQACAERSAAMSRGE